MVFPQINQLQINATSIANSINRGLAFVKDAVIASFVPEVNYVYMIFLEVILANRSSTKDNNRRFFRYS
ncbi:hypothetical protein NIES2119_00610 [[Phormidium ambiguum] IAM M-71]|uniref:Uncharacterized protein n=1 Tax=[Phormidium ambiguum] IAM M-71 TaxID=454136 RepID=A0A1U7ITS8_9CYAN|nr:hypothetical protein NIES2119_00610 [Phormidium ambiguum IAM M-71]